MSELRAAAARDLGPQFTRNPHRMVGQDGAYSIPLADGTALWYFGDTLVGARVPGESLWFPGGKPLGPGDMSGHGSIERLYTNTGLLLRDTTGRDGLNQFAYLQDDNGDLRQLVHRIPGEHPDQVRVWCLHGVEVGADIFLFYQNVRMLATGPMPVNFEILGSGLARGNRHTWTFERIPRDPGTLWWGADLPQFASAVLRGHPDGHLYTYGVLKGADGVQRAYLARVQPPDLANHKAFEYLASPSPQWSRDPRSAIPIMTGMPNEMSVSWNEHLASYLAVHSLDLTGRIVGRTAPQPWGPWSEAAVLWNCAPPRIDYKIPYAPLIYAAKEHPELAQQRGRVLYITYIEFEEYFPHLVEVTLP